MCDQQRDDFGFDFIALSEVFKCDGDKRLALPGFHELLIQCRDDGYRGGVGLFIKDSFNYRVRDDLGIFVPHVYESLFVEIMSTSSKNQIIGVIYRPNTAPRADLEIFSAHLYETMDKINLEHKPTIIMGDFNIDLLKYGSHRKTNEFVDNVFSQGFMPLIHKPTRITPSSATLIDHIYSNDFVNENNKQSGVILTDVADHLGIFYLVRKKSVNNTNLNGKTRFFSETNILKFKYLLKQANFENIMKINDPEYAFNTFMETYNTAFESSFPLKTIRPNKKYIKRDPWVTHELLASSRMKTKLLHKKMKNPTEENIHQYKTYLNMYNKMKRSTKSAYYKDILDINKSNIKKTWKILNEAIGRNYNKAKFPQSFTINNVNVTERLKFVQEFNNFYINIGKQTSQNVPKVKTKYTDYLNNPSMNSIFLEPVEPEYVIEVTNKLKPKLSCGYDNISN